MWVTGCLADSLTSANTGSPTPTPVMTTVCLELSCHLSCFKECGLDCEFSYQQREWALRILYPVDQAGGHAQVWGVLKGQRAWQPGLTTSFHSPLTGRRENTSQPLPPSTAQPLACYPAVTA